jgi:hypothetical protein
MFSGVNKSLISIILPLLWLAITNFLELAEHGTKSIFKIQRRALNLG